MLVFIATSFVGGAIGLFFWLFQRKVEEEVMLEREIRDGIAELIGALYDEKAGSPITTHSRALAAKVDSAVGSYASRMPFWRRGRARGLSCAWEAFYGQFKAKNFVKLYEVPEQQRMYAAYCEGQLVSVLDALKR